MMTMVMRFCLFLLGVCRKPIQLSHEHLSHRRSLLLLLLLTTTIIIIIITIITIIPSPPLLLPLVVIACVVDPQCPPAELRAVEVVHSEVSGALVLVRQEAEPLGSTSLLVSDEVNVHDFAILGEHGQDVPLRQRVVQIGDEYVGRVAEVVVPGGTASLDAHMELPLVESLNRSGVVHCIRCV